MDETLANAVIPQPLLASRTAKPARGIDLYIDSPGGTLGAALSVYDFVQSLRMTVATTCIGTAGPVLRRWSSPGGTSSQRYALPHARVHLMDETTEFEPRRASDLAIHVQAVRDQSARRRAALLKHVRCPPEGLVAELSAPRWLTAQEAQSLGLIDALAVPRPRTAYAVRRRWSAAGVNRRCHR